MSENKIKTKFKFFIHIPHLQFQYFMKISFLQMSGSMGSEEVVGREEGGCTLRQRSSGGGPGEQSTPRTGYQVPWLPDMMA